MKMSKRSSAIAVAVFVIALIWAGFVNMGLAYAVIVGGSGTIAYFAWLLTTFEKPADPQRILPLYLLMVATELIHMTEEIVTGFPEKFPLMFNVTVTDKAFEASFLIVSAIGVLAAIGLIYRNSIADYFVWFYAIGPGIVNGIAHFVFPMIAGTYYFPGLITVLMPFIVSIILIKRLVSGGGEARETLPQNA